MTKNYAGIDLGSNSCKMIICDENKKVLFVDSVSTRLAEGMYKNNRITDEAIERCQKCFFEYKKLFLRPCQPHGCGALRHIADIFLQKGINDNHGTKKAPEKKFSRACILQNREIQEEVQDRTSTLKFV